ncbi:MAG: hypothetical protein SOR77_05860 [Peptoniphilus sp.]|uniref:hypothetical protein n=1 Tax=Peptoniphilus sp. TaxID=1971214 RepID=UPI002A756CF6|nr:hypothetical protein [Peptoniphilus sp.]MDY2987145.1 hypothetical protein [Peptoniphilus sp.]
MKKKFSFLLAMTFLIQCMSFVYANDIFAEEVETNSTNYFSSKILPIKLNEQGDLTHYVENLTIDGKNYTFVHREENGYRIIEMSGAEEGIFKSKIEDDTSIKPMSYRAANDDWQYFQYWKQASWIKGTAVAGIAAKIASVVGGPVRVFIDIASTLYGVYHSVDIDYSGRYRLEGGHVRGEYTAKIYGGSDYIGTTNWSGYR